MNKNLAIKITGLGMFFASLLMISGAVFADTFTLSYSLTEGGSRLELDPANAYKGVKIDVSSDIGCRYEVIQKITQPLENRDNPQLNLEDNLVVRGLRGTNIFGILNIPTNDIPVRSGELLYTSNTTGNPDTFTLVYGINNLENITPGYYQGQMSFTLRPIGSDKAEAVQYLYIYVTISQASEVKPIIEISTSNHEKTIILNPQKEDAKTADALVEIGGHFKKLFSLNQVLLQPLESEEGSQLNYDLVMVGTKETKQGIGIVQTPLNVQPQVLYTSLPDGRADESFVLTYSLGDLTSQKAGRYHSLIQFYLDEMGVQSKIEILELVVENERVFELVVTPPEQKGTLEFTSIKPGQPPKTIEVAFEIKTNTGKKYQVTQKVYSDLTNKEGNILASKNFSLRTESLETKGKLQFTQKEEIKKGEAVLFLSDDLGSADKFRAIYELSCPPEAKGGDYTTNITYSLSEI